MCSSWTLLLHRVIKMSELYISKTGVSQRVTWSACQKIQLNHRENAHVAYCGRVYDISKFVASHPGGAEQFLLGAGKDITLTFESYHSPNVVKILEKYYVGDLIDSELSNLSWNWRILQDVETTCPRPFQIDWCWSKDWLLGFCEVDVYLPIWSVVLVDDICLSFFLGTRWPVCYPVGTYGNRYNSWCFPRCLPFRYYTLSVDVEDSLCNYWMFPCFLFILMVLSTSLWPSHLHQYRWCWSRRWDKNWNMENQERPETQVLPQVSTPLHAIYNACISRC